MWIEHLLAEASSDLINVLIPHSMLQEVRISVVLPVANFCIETPSSSPVCQKSVYFLLKQTGKKLSSNEIKETY
jgi:hypothetical protein